MTNLHRDRKRILFVEDHEDTWEVVAFHLREYQLTIARNFNEGLHLARQRYFDLYILDNWLPDGSGIELCHLIRKFDPNTPILFYSATDNEHDMEEALRTCAQVYLVKPTGIDELERCVTRLMSVAGKRNSEAWQAEVKAIREELAVQRLENVELKANAKEKHLRSKDKLMRLKAEKAFLEAGGTRGDFARRWPSVFVEEVLRRRAGE